MSEVRTTSKKKGDGVSKKTRMTSRRWKNGDRRHLWPTSSPTTIRWPRHAVTWPTGSRSTTTRLHLATFRRRWSDHREQPTSGYMV